MEAVARATAGNVCSTLADLRSGRPTEYDSINGAVLRRGRLAGMSLPALEELDRRFLSLLAERLVHQGAS
jgi:ketopantoate reductase